MGWGIDVFIYALLEAEENQNTKSNPADSTNFAHREKMEGLVL